MVAALALLVLLQAVAGASRSTGSNEKPKKGRVARSQRTAKGGAAKKGPERRPPRRRDRWEGYAAGTGIDHFAWWCRTYLIQTVDPFAGQPLELEEWELEFMSEALAVDAELRLVWLSVVLVVSRKNGKTALLAAYALYHLFNDEGSPEILLAAASDRNAGRLFDACVAFCRANQELEARVHIREYVGEIGLAGGGGKIIRLATDPTTLHGYNPSLVICDELHAWTKPSLRKVWAALTSAGGARARRQVFTISTAGEASQRKEGILGRLIDGNEGAGELEQPTAGLTISRNFKGETMVYNYSAPTIDPHDVKAMKLANPASWITLAYLERQAADPELSDAEVLQLHGCVWATGERTWMDPKLVENLARRGGPIKQAQLKGREVVLAFDGSYSRDSTVLYGATVEQHPYLWVEDLWEKPGDAASGWRVSRLDVDAAVRDAMERYRVLELAPDPPGWHREIEEWEETFGEVVVRFETNQPRRMGPACDDFEQAARDEEFTTDGHEALIRHLAHCVPKRRGAHTIVTKEEPDSPLKIDVAIGAIIAYHRAHWHWTRQQEEAEPMVAWG